MRHIAADYILTPEGILTPGLKLILDNSGQVVDLIANNNNDAEYYTGILCPGFINTHCHLELSYMKDKISRAAGLDGFIKEFISTRRTFQEGIPGSISQADELMWKNGIQGVGDICNNDLTFSVKKQSDIRYHSFVEIFNMNPLQAEDAFQKGLELEDQARQSHHFASIAPHAPYSVPPVLFNLIKNHLEKTHAKFSIHNQETAAENEMFQSGSGKLMELFKSIGIDMSWFNSTRTNSIEEISKYFPSSTSLLLVHNTFSTLADINFLQENNFFQRCWFSLCPKANLYIENRLPDVEMLDQQNCLLTFGTDSLASNDTLSVLEEIKTLHRAFPSIPLQKMFTWATKNGAEYFDWNDLGSFQKGTRPGVLQITNSTNLQLTDQSEINRIV